MSCFPLDKPAGKGKSRPSAFQSRQTRTQHVSHTVNAVRSCSLFELLQKKKKKLTENCNILIPEWFLDIFRDQGNLLKFNKAEKMLRA